MLAKLTLHAFATPNSLKPVIALEEMGLPYDIQPVDLRKGAQRGEDLRALNPNGKVPVLVDNTAASGGIVLSESAAILVHLAEKSGHLLPIVARSPGKSVRTALLPCFWSEPRLSAGLSPGDPEGA
jgi:GSH-dependent disulfide-bond oxidoreductase